ncbi:hypothetical protein DRN76_03270 [Methanosarcinales archaeon]|nr:MAG: hypothetical protein DRN76_03270 [Methanosarcinales archaeon]
MKILLIVRIINKQGGISRYVAELAERFAAKHETHLLTTIYNYEIQDLIIHKKPMIKKPLWLQFLSNVYYNAKYAKKIKDENHIDVVGSNAVESWECDIVTMHSCHKAWNKYYRSWDLLRNIRGVIDPYNIGVLTVERHVLEKGSKKIISVSEGVKREILENYNVPEDKIAVIPNGVDLEEFSPDPQKRIEIRNQYNIDENDIVLLFTGYEFKRKGLEYIIRALPKIDKNVKLFAVGKSNPKPFQKLANKLGVSDNIIFTGFVQEISDYYAASDIFVFPTAYEAFSLATLEAVASGLPILATKVNGTEELIDDRHNGFFIKRDPADISEKINILIEDETLRKQMGKNARETAENYSWDEIARRTMEVYEEVAKR